MSDWVEDDAASITRWAYLRFPHLPLMAVGHSVGGHAIALSSATRSLSAAVMVASHAGVTRTIENPVERLRVWFVLRLLGPSLCRICGYMPARQLRLGENIPGPVMRQWSYWSTLPDYFYDDPLMDAGRRAGKVNIPLLVLGFKDDPWANFGAITRLLRHMKNANIERHSIAPRDAGVTRIGHMGFFNRRCAETLWPVVGMWLLKQAGAEAHLPKPGFVSGE